ncbi:uncharacterized protein LOC130876799 [Chionomys nivalis]|uniref:uncharacterized protein LOC130876799 n=1 Tax=Chionomys nivalis TaxID=269649 RepID=UPI002594CCD2|nr:uncharacterized protein LOC130876799 [Chionomys nivalis]
MGGYLGRARHHCPFLTVSIGDLQKRPSPPVHSVSRSLRANSMDRCLNMADSLPFEDDEALADSQEHPGRVMVVHMQRYLVEKVRDLLIGVFSSMFLCGQHISVPTLSDSRMFRGSVILKVISTKGRAILCFVLGQPILNLWSFLTGYLSTQFSALQVSSKSKRVRQKKKKNSSTLRKGGEGFAKQEEGSPVIKRPSDQGTDSDGGVSAQSAFRRLIVNDVLSSFIPRPGPLGMDICSKNSAKSCIKESQIAFKSAYKRNAIASSYSSTLAQWPPGRVPTRATGRAVPRTASGATVKPTVLSLVLLQGMPQMLLQVLPEVLLQMLLQVLAEVLPQMLLQVLAEVLPQMLLQVLPEVLLQVLPEVLSLVLFQGLLQELLHNLLQGLPQGLPQMLMYTLPKLLQGLLQMLLQGLLQMLMLT